MCLAAPLWANHVADTDPYKNHLTDTIVVGGKTTDVVAPDGVPIGPTWRGHFFLGADESGRDIAVRLLYGGRTSLLIGGGAALLTILLSILAGTLAGYFGGWTDTIISRLLDIIWSFPVLLLGVALGTALALEGLQIGPIVIDGESLIIPLLIIGVVYVPYMAGRCGGRSSALREKEFVEAARAQGLGPIRIMFSEILPNLVVDDHRLLPAHGRQRDPARGGAVVPRRRGAAPDAVVGNDDRRRGHEDRHRAPPGDRARDDARAHGARAERLRRRRPRRVRSARQGARGAMTRFVVRRLIAMLAVLFAISLITFGIFNLIPNGDPALRLAGRTPTPGQLDAIRRTWGLDKPLPVQYVRMMEQVFTGELVSYANQTNVLDEIVQGFPRTLSLAIGAGAHVDGFAIALGLYTAVRAGRFSDRFLTVLALIGISMPVFWVGALMNYYLGFKAGIFPNGGYVELTENPLQWAYHLIMPWTALSILFIGFYSRVLRSNLLDTMNDDYVRTARAKGITERRILIRHVLRNSMIPIVTLWGLDFGAIVGGGAILTEVVFNLQGVGQYAAESIGQLDVPPVMAITMFLAFFVVVTNTLVDILYAAMDPRIRLS